MKVRAVAAYTDGEGTRRFRICVRPDGFFQIATEEWCSRNEDGQQYSFWRNLYPPSGIYQSVEEAKAAIDVMPEALVAMAPNSDVEFDLSCGPYPDL